MGLFDRLKKKTKETIDERGGVESVKEDALELKEIAEGEGSRGEKAKQAIEAIKEPGAGEEASPPEAPEGSA